MFTVQWSTIMMTETKHDVDEDDKYDDVDEHSKYDNYEIEIDLVDR